MAGDVFFRWVMGVNPLAIRLQGAVIALLFAVGGSHWGAQGMLAAVAALAIAVVVIEMLLESRKS